ncbi:MAG: AmpG family muropeptide MFS transporter [Coxiellaceae bacterium]|nr:AmpG family muropeptide MFS transporter [Coxiellaceae bacterium]
MQRYFNKRVLSIFFMGFASGLPLGLVGATLQAWYTVSGASLIAIGWLTLVGQPYAYKFLWAPLLDRFEPFSLGRRRSWIICMQALLVLGLCAMGFLNPAKNPLFLAFIALSVAIFSATQDTAIDAYRTELLEEHERGIGVSASTVAYRIAMMVSSALALMIASVLSWHSLYFLMAGCFVVLMLITWRSPNPAVSSSPPTSMRAAMLAPLVNFFSRKHAFYIILFIVLYKLCDAMALSLNTAFLLRVMHFSLIQIGAISKTVGLTAGLMGSVVGGFLLPYFNLYRSLIIFGFLQLASNLLYAWLYIVGKNITIMSIAIFGENFCSGLATVAFIVFLMQLCDKRYTATQYALFSAFASLGRIFIGPVSAVLVDHIGWVDFYIVSSLVGLPALVIMFFFCTEKCNWILRYIKCFDASASVTSVCRKSTGLLT